jgi:hypothetical protein
MLRRERQRVDKPIVLALRHKRLVAAARTQQCGSESETDQRRTGTNERQRSSVRSAALLTPSSCAARRTGRLGADVGELERNTGTNLDTETNKRFALRSTEPNAHATLSKQRQRHAQRKKRERSNDLVSQ